MNLKEIKKEIEGQVIDEKLCIDLIEKGDELKGYGLYLAKEVLHKDSNTGWEKFCEKIGISRQNANRQIVFYKAKSEPIGYDFLPKKEYQYRELKGETVEEKVEHYEKVKELTEEEEPTSVDIKIVEVAEKAATTPEGKRKLVKALKEAPTKARDAFIKSKSTAGKKFREAVEQGLDEDRIIEAFTPKPSIPATDPKTTKMIEKLRRQAKGFEIKIITRAEYNMMKEKNAEYEAEVIMNSLGKLTSITETILRRAREAEQTSKQAEFEIAVLAKESLKTIGISIAELKTPGKLKAIYLKKAKERHPDKGGDHDLMTDLNTAYNHLKQFVKERE